MRQCCSLILCTILAVNALAVERKRSELRRNTLNAQAIVSNVAGNSLSYAIRHSRAWGKGAAGYGKYVGAHLGQHLVKNTVQYGVGSWRGEDYRYQPSGKKGVLPRTAYALTRTVYVPRRNKPGRTVAAGRIGGAFGAGLISRAWYPAALNSVGSGLASGGMALGADAAGNVAREFWPRPKSRRARR